MLALQGMSQFVLVLLLAAGPGGAAAKGGAAELERGEKLFKAGDLTGALQAFDNASKTDPKDARAPYLRGVVLEKKNDLAGAEKAYREAIARDGRFGPAHNNLGAILLGRNDLPGAEKELVAATASEAKNASAAFNLGLLREAQKQPREAAVAYRKSLQINPNDGTCHANLCSVLRKVGDLDGAIAECRQAVRLMPESAVVLTNLGLLLSDKKQFDEARDQLLLATQKDAKFAPAWTGLGRVELRRKQAAAAVDALAKAAKLEPKDSSVAADFCRALVEKDMRARAAEEECRRAVALDAKNGLAHYELVKILVARGDCAGAKAEVGKLGAIESAKGQAKEKAEEIVKTCVPGKAVKPTADAKGGERQKKN
jgi:Flp pilus assembly protein TadD